MSRHYSDEFRKSALELLLVNDVKTASKMLDIPERTLRGWRKKLSTPFMDDEFKIEAEKEPLDLDSLVDERIRKFNRKKRNKEKSKLIPVSVNIDGPIGIAHFGDPHVDDDGTDLGLLLRHAELCRDTPGLMAGNVGDLQNNWIGRLARLWAEQSTSAKEAWALTEHFVKMVPWLYLVSGNHDAWSGTGDPLDWIMNRHEQYSLSPAVARLELKFPNGKRVRVHSRHTFKGVSQWNTAHGPSKAIQMGWRDHILTCGHTHVSGYQVLKDPSSGLISHALRIGSYKTYDRYAEEHGFPDQTIFICPVTIIDPQYDDDDPRLVTTIFDPEEAAEYLTWKRSKM